MKPEDELTAVERKWGRELQRQPLGRCLEGDELLDLAAMRSPSAYSGKMQTEMRHVLTCRTCRMRLADLKQAEALRQSHAQGSLSRLLGRVFSRGGRSQAGSPSAQDLLQTPSRTAPKAESGRFAAPPDLPGAPAASGPLAAVERFAPATSAAPVPIPAPARRSSLHGAWFGRFAYGGLVAAALICVVMIEHRRSGKETSPALGPLPSQHDLAGGTAGTDGAVSGSTLRLIKPDSSLALDKPVTLNWIANEPATRYRVEITDLSRLGGSSTGVHLLDSTAGSSYRLQPNQLQPGTLYRWTVYAYRAGKLISTSSTTLKFNTPGKQ